MHTSAEMSPHPLSPLTPSSSIKARTAIMKEELADLVLGLYNADIQAAMTIASDQGKVALTVISERFKEYESSPDAKRLRITLGMAAREILENAGYEVDKVGVKVPDDPFFTTGTRYRKAPQSHARGVEDAGLLSHMLDGLDLARLIQLSAMINARIARK